MAVREDASLIGLALRFNRAISSADPARVVGQDALVTVLRSVGRRIRALLKQVQQPPPAPRAPPACILGKLTKM